MKKIVIVFALLIGATTVSFAQAAKTAPATATTAPQQQRQPPTAEQRAQSMTERMDKMLTLTPDQKKSIQAVNVTVNNKVDAMRKNTDKTAPREDIKGYRDAEYKKILTPEQFEKFESSMKPHVAATPAPAPAT